jgi:putative endonuclease
MTNNLEKRIKEHNNGYEKTTKPYTPFKLIYKEELETRPEARIREKYFKS